MNTNRLLGLVAGASLLLFSTPSLAAPSSAKALLSHGRAVYSAKCAMCHQSAGQGVPGVFPPLAGSPYTNGPAARHIKIVLNGRQGSLSVKGQTYNGVMPAWKQLSDKDLAAVISFERTSWGNHGSIVTPQEVHKLR